VNGDYLGGAGAELEEAGLAVGGLVLELFDLAALRLALLLQPPDLHRVLRRPNVPIAEPRHPNKLRGGLPPLHPPPPRSAEGEACGCRTEGADGRRRADSEKGNRDSEAASSNRSPERRLSVDNGP
jgi:hypothetical protein